MCKNQKLIVIQEPFIIHKLLHKLWLQRKCKREQSLIRGV